MGELGNREAVIGFAFADGADREIALPAYETAGAAGMDLRANFAADRRAKGYRLAPGARALIPTGLHIELPLGFEAQIRPRSGLALKQGITLLNSPGTIDADYRGEIGVILINLSDQDFLVAHGARIAQMVIAPMVQLELVERRLGETKRGAGGFGSTGTG